MVRFTSDFEFKEHIAGQVRLERLFANQSYHVGVNHGQPFLVQSWKAQSNRIDFRGYDTLGIPELTAS